jgi:hypothetical protein
MSVADNGVSIEAHMRIFHQAHVKWLSRVSETSTPARAALAQHDEIRPGSQKTATCMGSVRSWASRRATSARSLWTTHRAQARVQCQVTRTQAEWEKICWHLGTRRVACEMDAQTAVVDGQ